MSSSNGVTGGVFANLADLQASRQRIDTVVQLTNGAKYKVVASNTGANLPFSNGTFAEPIGIITPGHFGAAEDLTTDDSSEVQLAINYAAASGKEFAFRSSGVSSTINMLSNLKIGSLGSGYNLRALDGLNGHILTGSNLSNVSVKHLKIDGNGANQTAGSSIRFVESDDIQIEDNIIDNSYSSSIICEESSLGCNRLSIKGNKCTSNLNSYCIVVDHAFNSLITDNIIKNPAESGIQVFLSDNLSVANNIVEHNGSPTNGFGGVRITATTGSNSTISVTGNSITGMSRGVFIGDNTSNVTVQGNVIENTGREGVFLTSGQVNECTISGNIIKNCGTETANTYSAIINNNNTNIIVTENQITDDNSNMRYAIDNGGGSSDCIISGNYIGEGVTGDIITSPNNVIENNVIAGYRDGIASASSITLPFAGKVFNITGTSTIDTINGFVNDRVVTLTFGSTATVSDGAGNIALSGAFNATAGDTLTLVYIAAASQWREISRSVN